MLVLIYTPPEPPHTNYECILADTEKDSPCERIVYASGSTEREAKIKLITNLHMLIKDLIEVSKNNPAYNCAQCAKPIYFDGTHWHHADGETYRHSCRPA